jgi:hypothetical protein
MTHLIIFYLAALLSGGSANAEWISLFNGKDLQGWSIRCLEKDRDREYWTVNNGTIVCNSMGDGDHGYVWLMTDREFSDFHLRLQFQCFRSSGGNSGVQFRSRYDDSDTARNGGWLNGPQADIHPPLPMRTGLIYDETEGVRRWIFPSLPDWRIGREQFPESALETRLVYADEDPSMWNTLEIISRGMHVKTLVNGNEVADFDARGILDDKLHAVRHVGTRGHIALQLHQNDELLIRFRNIQIREL